jgi:DNA (cytosine-5)-methyltransferase 1
MTVFRLGELFCGPGGLALGSMNAKVLHKGKTYLVKHAFATDIDPSACATYIRNICNRRKDHVYCRDVRKLNIEKLPGIDALAFGFPCNDYSIVGEQKGIKGEYGPLYIYGKKVLDAKKPKWFIAENVGGMRNDDDGKTFAKIIDDLKNSGPGYELTPHLYKFEEYGVPQKRHRIIIVGIDIREKLKFKVPAPTTKHHPINAMKAIEVPPILPGTPNNEYTRQSKTVIERLQFIPEGQNAWYKGIPEHLRLKVKGAFLSQIYKRLKRDEPAYTITGSGGGGTHGYHWSEPRALTNRERARLQTFPDDFIFVGSKEQVRKQIGMAVPPKGAEVIVKAILMTFAGMEYKHVRAHWEIEGGEE